jgi:hypothetical protein
MIWRLWDPERRATITGTASVRCPKLAFQFIVVDMTMTLQFCLMKVLPNIKTLNR